MSRITKETPLGDTPGKRRKRYSNLPVKRVAKGKLVETFLSEDNEKVILRCAELGLRERTAAEICGMTEQQFRDMLIRAPEFALNYRRARREGDMRLANTLMEVAIHDRSVPALIFLAKTRLHWRETDRLEVTGPEGGPIQHKHVAIKADDPPDKAAEEWARFRDAKLLESSDASLDEKK